MNIVDKMYILISDIKDIPIKDISSIEELLEHSEWGVAFEILCSALYQEYIEITSEQYDCIVDMGGYMDFDEELWINIKHS